MIPQSLKRYLSRKNKLRCVYPIHPTTIICYVTEQWTVLNHVYLSSVMNSLVTGWTNRQRRPAFRLVRSLPPLHAPYTACGSQWLQNRGWKPRKKCQTVLSEWMSRLHRRHQKTEEKIDLGLARLLVRIYSLSWVDATLCNEFLLSVFSCY